MSANETYFQITVTLDVKSELHISDTGGGASIHMTVDLEQLREALQLHVKRPVYVLNSVDFATFTDRTIDARKSISNDTPVKKFGSASS